MSPESVSGVKAAKNDTVPTVKRGFKIRGAKARSKVTNGVKLLPGYDGRTIWGRRFHDLCALHAADSGGVDTLSEAQVSLIRRAAALEVTLENLELDMACGREVDLDQYSRCAGHLRRILETVGIRRVAKDTTPSLSQIVAQHRQEAAGTPESIKGAPVAANGVSRTQPAFPSSIEGFEEAEAPG